MPKLAPEIQTLRRDRILDAAERCFAERGFHATTMHDIYREAGVSAGALYTYFRSKEELIAGLCQREGDRFATELGRLSVAPDLLLALRSLAEQYCCNEPQEKVRLHIEIGAEASRNPEIAKTLLVMQEAVTQGFADLFAREEARGRIRLKFPVEVIVRAMGAVGDGLFWHRALDPNFDPRPIIPAVMEMIAALLAPGEGVEASRLKRHSQ